MGSYPQTNIIAGICSQVIELLVEQGLVGNVAMNSDLPGGINIYTVTEKGRDKFNVILHSGELEKLLK